MTVQPDDLLLVNRAGIDYQTEAKNLFTPVCELDELPVPLTYEDMRVATQGQWVGRDVNVPAEPGTTVEFELSTFEGGCSDESQNEYTWIAETNDHTVIASGVYQNTADVISFEVPGKEYTWMRVQCTAQVQGARDAGTMGAQWLISQA